MYLQQPALRVAGCCGLLMGAGEISQSWRQCSAAVCFGVMVMEKSWEILEGACYSCKKCRLWEMRTNVVIGKGNREADIMLIGEGPGQQEDLTGIPFVGPAGQLLDKMLAAVHLSLEDVYIANIVCNYSCLFICRTCKWNR